MKEEGRRLVYVAATRARNVLILCDSVRIIRGKESRNSKWSPIMETGLPDIFEVMGNSSGCPAETGAETDAAGLYEAAKQAAVLNDRSAEKATFKVENPSRQHVLSKLSESPEAGGEEDIPEFPEAVVSRGDADADADAVEVPQPPAGQGKGKEDTAGGRRFAALLGTMTHKLMEMLVTTRNKVDAQAAVGEIIREYSRPGTEGYESMLTETLLNAADHIRKGGYAQSNGLPRDILGTLLAADEVYCEVPFCYKDQSEETTVWNGVMDVIYSRDGQWHIVDYKTNADGSDLDIKYQAQLSAYVKAFKATTGLDADALTYHIDI